MPTVAVDPFGMKNISFVGPADNVALVTPSDTDELPVISREILVGTPGTLKVLTYGGQTVTLPASVVGLGRLTLRARKIFATGTTATDIVILW